MSSRNRSTNALAKRIDMEYFARPHAFRRWRLLLSIAVPAIALAWFVAQRVHGGQRAYMSGPLSHSHAVFAKQCSACHVQQAGAYFRPVEDQACLTCHDGPAHHENQTFKPACSSCHVEHKGSTRLSATPDVNCTQCHADLHTKQGATKYETSITGFETKHPEFRILRGGASDPGNIKLNHYVHLQPNLIGPNQTRVQLTCDDCHRPTGVEDTLPYPGTSSQLQYAAVYAQSDTQTTPPAPVRPSAYMAPPEFAKHCARCHLLTFDPRFGDLQVPHDKPDVVHTFLVTHFGEYVSTHPAAVHEVETFDRQLPERPHALKIAGNSEEWVNFRVEDAEWLLYRKTCKQCHTLIATNGPLPEVAKSQIVRRWLVHADFDHYPHRAVACSSCHLKAINSRETSDVLIAGIASCRSCHRDGGPWHEAAEGRCFECHQYHDWSRAKRTKGPYTIPELRGSARLSLP
jgi:hypothetical protein